jgi:hypothetical protein
MLQAILPARDKRFDEICAIKMGAPQAGAQVLDADTLSLTASRRPF